MEARTVCQAGTIQQAGSAEASRHLLNGACPFALLSLLPQSHHITYQVPGLIQEQSKRY